MSALKQIFVRVHFRYDQDAYAEDLESFAAWLLAVGYSNKAARTHLFRVQQVLHAVGAAPGCVLSAHVLQSTFHRLARRRWKTCHSHWAYTHYLRSVDRLIEPPAAPPNPHERWVQGFCERLTRQRGLAESTVTGYRFWIYDFLARMLSPDQPLTDLTSTTLESYIQSRGPMLAPRTFRTGIKCVQRFLQDCHERGLFTQRIDQIDLPRGFRYEQPPRALPWPLVERLLDSIDCTTHVGQRDYTILHLMAYYGLRTGELAHLTLDSINWRAAALTVQQTKTHSTLMLPLHQKTLDVLSNYLKMARPSSDLPWLFLRGAAPRAPMTKYALSYLFKTRARRSGLPITQYSSYSLRHGFAMRLFQRGVGMKAIGDLMGHRSLISTGVYLRLQAQMLREVALPVPVQSIQVGGAP